ncbi:ImmA/IrrE family metallo-endopeptidase, partial [Campylobacter jejuni]
KRSKMYSPDYAKATNIAADLLLTIPDIKSGRPINFNAILDNQGIRVEIVPELPVEAQLDPVKKIIKIRQDNMPIQRKFFSIAHELGHWFLHSRDKIRNRYSNCDGDYYFEEQEANAFAAELLMPFNEVAKCIMWGYSVIDLMDRFNVSFEFASIRYDFVSNGIY